MRGINIGYIDKIQVKYNYVLIKVNINLSSILIPKNSLVETSQTGLLNDTVIDITPLQIINNQDVEKFSVFTKSCVKSIFLCHYDYIRGERGLNYDDLVRAATRISQRFDDPMLFQLASMLLQNTINISNEFIEVTDNVANITILIYDYLYKLFFN
uniref:Ycf22 n=1 Tax=Gracilaria firma TaxID=2510791 RepID=A0A2Z2JLM9_9FLOR|nr:Ycf22 [Gracilaria changii]ART65182.1 Ycf22 [Gracilaria changii]